MKPYMWAMLAALSWGFAPIVEKLGLMKLPVTQALFFRCLGVVVGLMLLIVFKFSEFKQVVQQVPSGWGYLVAGGFMASIVGQIFFYNALKGGEASRVVPIGASYPLISFVLGIFFLSEKVTVTKLVGLILIMAGVYFVR